MTNEKIKLYDLKSGESPEAIRGTSFRSLQIYSCRICHAQSNHQFYGGYPGWGLREVCPANQKFRSEHENLEALLDKRDELKKEMEIYELQSNKNENNQRAAEIILPSLSARFVLIDSSVFELRSKLSQVSDIEGIN